MAENTLRDLGEREIVNRFIVDRFEKVRENFDDAAVIDKQDINGNLVITTDPCPEPVAFSVIERDMRLYGDMTVLINVSDLASMGAQPLGILISSIMPEDMPETEYKAFLDGVERSCTRYHCPLLGGNIKDGPRFSATATALGIIPEGKALKRSSAEEGDLICVIGKMGLFWSAIAAFQQKIDLSESEKEILIEALVNPCAKIKEGQFLQEYQYATSCMDCSDSIFTCLRELSLASHRRMIVENNRLQPEKVVSKVARAMGIDQRNLMFSWGDWQLVCTIKQKNLEAVTEKMNEWRQSISVIGRVAEGSEGVLVEEEGEVHTLSMELSSERFSKTSIFSHGIHSYLQKMKTAKF